jgi:dihydropteroate synthase
MPEVFLGRKKYLWQARGLRLELGGRTQVMGIVNITPDSFSGDGILSGSRKEKVPGLSYALDLIDEGADILDIGGESSRPGAKVLSAREEAARVIPLITALARRVDVPISVDTYKPLVAKEALKAGAVIVNLIKGVPADPAMLDLVGKAQAGLILMHMRGTPLTMQGLTRYDDVVIDVKRELSRTLAVLSKYGIKKDAVVIDPGIGFAKNVEQNLVLMQRLGEFASLGFPLLAGTSRKSFIGKTLGVDVDDRLSGTAATVTLAAAFGAHIVRVHDVKAMKQAVMMADAVRAAK